MHLSRVAYANVESTTSAPHEFILCLCLSEVNKPGEILFKYPAELLRLINCWGAALILQAEHNLGPYLLRLQRSISLLV